MPSKCRGSALLHTLFCYSQPHHGCAAATATEKASAVPTGTLHIKARSPLSAAAPSTSQGVSCSPPGGTSSMRPVTPNNVKCRLVRDFRNKEGNKNMPVWIHVDACQPDGLISLMRPTSLISSPSGPLGPVGAGPVGHETRAFCYGQQISENTRPGHKRHVLYQKAALFTTHTRKVKAFTI
jgi:hypothetical protein